LELASGTTAEGENTYRIGYSYDRHWSCFSPEEMPVTPRWEIGFTYLEKDTYPETYVLSFAPTIHFQPYSTPWFFEFGIGISFFTHTRAGDKQLGTAINFEDRMALGLKLSQHHTIGLRAIHYSNAGIKKPNEGIESYSLFFQARLD
jgi:lipid A 3-O-deacylase